MSVSNYDRWHSDWRYHEESASEDAHEVLKEVKYSGEDMLDAYQGGSNYYQVNSKYIRDLERANSSMMRLIIANDQKQALMEASPEFGEELKKLSSPT